MQYDVLALVYEQRNEWWSHNALFAALQGRLWLMVLVLGVFAPVYIDFEFIGSFKRILFI